MTKQYDNFADLITFTRASTGTYLDSDGLLKTATTNTPRIEYDINGNRKGLLIEEARTNLLKYSDFDAAVPTNWSVGFGTGTFSHTLGTQIQGTPTITQVQSTSGRSFLNQNVTLLPSTTYTFSCKIDLAASSITSGSIDIVAISNFSDTPFTVATLGNVDPVTGLLKITFTTGTGTTGAIRLGIGASTTATGTLVFSQPQLEAGSFPTSYIPTAGAAASRSADVASIPTSAFGYNADKGTVVVDFETQFGTPVGFPRIWEIGGATSGVDRVTGFINAANSQIRCGVLANGVTAADFSVKTDPTPASGKLALAFADNDFSGVIDSGSPVIDTAGSLTTPSIPRNTLKFGGAVGTSASNMSGHLKSIQYYPRRLSNAQLQRLTS